MSQAATAAAVDELLELLERLVVTLEDEQRAIRTLDARALGELAVEKERLAGAIAAAGAAPRAHAAGHPRGAALRTATARAQALSHANRLLLDDAVALVGRRLGVEDAGTYDARARRVRSARPTQGRAI